MSIVAFVVVWRLLFNPSIPGLAEDWNPVLLPSGSGGVCSSASSAGPTWNSSAGPVQTFCKLAIGHTGRSGWSLCFTEIFAHFSSDCHAVVKGGLIMLYAYTDTREDVR